MITSSLTLCLAIGWVAKREDRDGLRPLTYCLALHALTYCLYALRGRIPDLLSVWVANVALVSAFSFLIHAVGVFLERRISRWVLLTPVAVVALGFAAFMSNISARMAINGAVFLVQELILLGHLARALRESRGRGIYLLTAGVFLFFLVLAITAIAELSGSERIQSITDPTLAQSLRFLSAFVSLNLVSLGFVLMTKERADERTRQMAMKDKLTDCWNRFRIEEVAQQEMLRLARYGTPVSLIMIDLDFFKAINDQHGHGVGDQILKDFAATVQSCIRNTDVLGRWGGEEFIVLLPASSYFVTAAIAERIRAAVETAEHANGIRITASLGFSSCQSSDSWDAWLARADLALYRAKAEGRNRVEAEMPLLSEDSPSAPGVARLIWSREFETGNRMLDQQHRQLFEQANQLLGAMTGGASRQQIADRVASFLLAMEEHMLDEEALLEKLDYPDCEEHQAQHRRLIERARSLLERYARNELDLAELLHFVIYEFSAQHLLIEDGKYAPFVQRLTLAGR
ncbi:diguanylate cyclase [Niveibacterium terrae]|uniref:diguanylate cyclase n=1 Tax=Niveibacterium terrae TaxID=3373598 RepID=UPI003A8D2E4C